MSNQNTPAAMLMSGDVFRYNQTPYIALSRVPDQAAGRVVVTGIPAESPSLNAVTVFHLDPRTEVFVTSRIHVRYEVIEEEIEEEAAPAATQPAAVVARPLPAGAMFDPYTGQPLPPQATPPVQGQGGVPQAPLPAVPSTATVSAEQVQAWRQGHVPQPNMAPPVDTDMSVYEQMPAPPVPQRQQVVPMEPQAQQLFDAAGNPIPAMPAPPTPDHVHRPENVSAVHVHHWTMQQRADAAAAAGLGGQAEFTDLNRPY